MSIYFSGTKCSRALNLYLSFASQSLFCKPSVISSSELVVVVDLVVVVVAKAKGK